ncbi:hypothetical protein E2C01_054589 [Portunus trituberculatus]|uniref:Uncharacterized protein n=1 Tax=Portunus trituberculatus TaxID=210409 RepID=A0A5B7GK94_PORTR|nr:hypothetical protein [Portunus trituberculatus]
MAAIRIGMTNQGSTGQGVRCVVAAVHLAGQSAGTSRRGLHPRVVASLLQVNCRLVVLEASRSVPAHRGSSVLAASGSATSYSTTPVSGKEPLHEASFFVEHW